MTRGITVHAPPARARRNSLLLATPIAVIAVGLLTWGWSSAAFTAQTRNIGNSWETGSLSLSDDDLGVAAFNLSDVLPGQTGEHCITVTSTSSTAGVVKLYLARMGADGLEDNITISTEAGTGGSFASCDGFVPEAPSDGFESIKNISLVASTYATGTHPWTTTGNVDGESKSYRFTWLFDTTGLSQAEIDALQGKSVSADVVWELQTP